jgi:hypothetical protein
VLIEKVIMMKSAILADSFKSYLLDMSSKKTQLNLLQSLTENGYVLESLMASAYFEKGEKNMRTDLENCIWAGRNAWIGSELPPHAQAGDIWMDMVEMMPMILIPFPESELVDWSEELLAKMGTNYAWFALRPVSNWQFKAFLALSVKATCETQVLPPFPVVNQQRIIDDTMLDSDVVNVLRSEAWIYALWFNKYLGGEWEYAYRYLTAEEINSCWGKTRKEWMDYYIDETTSAICTPETVLFDIDEGLESEDPEMVALAKSMICNEWKFFADVTFRTAIPVHVGLVNRWESPIEVGNIQFPSCFRR